LQSATVDYSNAMAEYVGQLALQLQEQNSRVTDLQVSFMNTADVMVAITVLKNFQIQIVLDL